jgi:Lauroyl/myristoyl acyltransferase
MLKQYVLLLRLFAQLPLWLTHALGGGLGLIAWLIPGKRRHVALTNLALCLPELNQAERRRLARRSFMHTGMMFTEAGKLWLTDYEQLERKIRSVHGEKSARRALESGRGVIFATPHLGSWELAGLYLAHRYPVTILYRPLLGPMDALIKKRRQRTGATLVPTTRVGVRTLYQALKRGEAVGLLPDHDPKKGVFALFFGVPAHTVTLVGRLATKTGATLFVGYAERLCWGRGWRVHYLEAEPGYADPDPVRAATVLNRMIEKCIRRVPEQYWWSYKRFRRRPPGKPKLY